MFRLATNRPGPTHVKAPGLVPGIVGRVASVSNQPNDPRHKAGGFWINALEVQRTGTVYETRGLYQWPL